MTIHPSLRTVASVILFSALTAAAAAQEKPVPPAERDSAVESRIDLLTLTRAGKQLNRVDVQAMEARLEEQPDDLDARTKLLAYYANDRAIESQKARRRHVLWIIEHHPDAAICGTQLCALNRQMEGGVYEQGRELWMKHAAERSTDTKMLSNAARYFLRNDQEAAEQMLLKARAAEPESPEWPRRLAGLYKLLGRYGDPKSHQAVANKALAQWKETYRLTADETGKLRLLSSLARSAFDADAYDEAATFAGQALAAVGRLEETHSHGEALFYGNMVLGRIALREGNMDEAKKRLLESGKTPGSPKLSAFGPNMSLAFELYKRGEPATVLQFLELCSGFWSRGQPKLDVWIEDIKNGRTPAFGPNLVI